MYQNSSTLDIDGDGDVRREGIGCVLKAAPEEMPCYLSVDIDALDPIYAPGTSTPVPGGFSPDEMKSMVRLLGSKRRIVGLDYMGAMTCRVACQLLLVALGAIKSEPSGRSFRK
jgi:hypothetical protein